MTQKLGEFDRLLARSRIRPSTRAGSLREQIDQLLGRAEKLETAAAGLTTQTSTLVTALRNPTSRGRWGEMQLRNVVEKAGMLPHCDFIEQQSVALDHARVRPDMTINLPGELRDVIRLGYALSLHDPGRVRGRREADNPAAGQFGPQPGIRRRHALAGAATRAQRVRPITS